MCPPVSMSNPTVSGLWYFVAKKPSKALKRVAYSKFTLNLLDSLYLAPYPNDSKSVYSAVLSYRFLCVYSVANSKENDSEIFLEISNCEEYANRLLNCNCG